MQEVNYRIPTIEELLLDGFKYEVKTEAKGDITSRFILVDFSTNEENIISEMITTEDKWEERTKQTLTGSWNITDSSGYEWRGEWNDDWDNPYQQKDFLQKLLDSGGIRCRVD